jgi:hypothetical protein
MISQDWARDQAGILISFQAMPAVTLLRSSHLHPESPCHMRHDGVCCVSERLELPSYRHHTAIGPRPRPRRTRGFRGPNTAVVINSKFDRNTLELNIGSNQSSRPWRSYLACRDPDWGSLPGVYPSSRNGTRESASGSSEPS